MITAPGVQEIPAHRRQAHLLYPPTATCLRRRPSYRSTATSRDVSSVQVPPHLQVTPLRRRVTYLRLKTDYHRRPG